NELEAAIGLGNLDVYQDILGKRRKNLLYLTQKFEKFSQYLSTTKEGENEKIGPHAFPIILKENVPFMNPAKRDGMKKRTEFSSPNRNQLVDYLEKAGVETRNLFSSMPTQCRGFSFLGYKLGDFPEAEYVGNNGLHIGIHQDLTEEHLDYVIETVDKFLSAYVK
ncbi:MAG: DegT/DnrJ/EryC1/StrS family aminotransferase, partial [Candidatus Azambacteria bacterium]|nr:DegT/DnrJ/EryC1/StrS family aminotransferase [Candidatus Azambacteria bacterium]